MQRLPGRFNARQCLQWEGNRLKRNQNMNSGASSLTVWKDRRFSYSSFPAAVQLHISAIEHKAAQEWQEYGRHICAQASQEHICAQAFSRTRRYIQARSVKVHKTSLCSAAIPMAMSCGISRRYLCTRDIMMWYNIQNVKKMYNNLSISTVVLYNLMKYQHAKEMYKLWEK